MTAIAIGTEPSRGVLYDETKHRVLDFCFNDVSEASAFLSSAERVGLNLWVGMPHSDLGQLVMLWRDAYRRN